VLDHYSENDVVEGRVTKVVTFGAFVEILPGVEGLVHISELAQHHVENPREVVSQGDAVNVLILEIDGERRRLSLSLKRVEEGMEPLPRADGGASVHETPDLQLSEDRFPTTGAAAAQAEVEEIDAGAEVAEIEAEVAEEIEAEAEVAEIKAEVAEIEAEAEVAEIEVEVAEEPEAQTEEPEVEAAALAEPKPEATAVGEAGETPDEPEQSEQPE
jgi:small subunit ribosomal protein S1